MRRSLGAVAFAVVCLASSQHDLANAGGKWFKRSAGCAAPYGCAMPYGCSGPTCGMPYGCASPGCYAPMCSGPTCGMPACHGPFAPLVAHYYGGCAAPGCFGPGCGGCGAPMCSMPGCGMPMMGCAAPTCGMPACGMPMGAYGNPMYAPQPQMGYDGFHGAPLMSGMPVSDYYAPMAPMAAPIPAVPAAEDVVW